MARFLGAEEFSCLLQCIVGGNALGFIQKQHAINAIAGRLSSSAAHCYGSSDSSRGISMSSRSFDISAPRSILVSYSKTSSGVRRSCAC